MVKPKSKVNSAGNYTKPTMRKALFEKLRPAAREATRVSGRRARRRCWPRSTRPRAGGTRIEGATKVSEGVDRPEVENL